MECNKEQEEAIMPVSYTHLDVYKRQRQDLSMTKVRTKMAAMALMYRVSV